MLSISAELNMLVCLLLLLQFNVLFLRCTTDHPLFPFPLTHLVVENTLFLTAVLLSLSATLPTGHGLQLASM